MLDVAALTAVLIPFVPYLTKVGEKAAEEAGQQFGQKTWAWAQQLWDLLRPKAEEKPSLKEAIEDVSQQPENDDAQASLRNQLKKLIQSDPDLAAQLEQLMQERPTEETGTIGSISAGGDAITNTGAQTTTQSGTGNISIGTARDVSFGAQSKSPD